MSALRREPESDPPDRVTGTRPDGAPATPKGDDLREQVRAENDDREARKESLDARIRRTEDRIIDHRVLLAARVSKVRGKVSGRLASPLLVLAAAGAGFAIALFWRRRTRSERARDRHRDDRPEVVMKPSIFASITDALTLATTLLAMMPLIRSKAKEGVQEATGEVPPS